MADIGSMSDETNEQLLETLEGMVYCGHYEGNSPEFVVVKNEILRRMKEGFNHG